MGGAYPDHPTGLDEDVLKDKTKSMIPAPVEASSDSAVRNTIGDILGPEEIRSMKAPQIPDPHHVPDAPPAQPTEGDDRA